MLWAGAPKAGNHAFYDIAVTPGDRTVRRKADQLVTAQLLGFDAPKVRLFAQYRGASKWEQVDMQPSPGASTYEFLFSGLADNVEYYVEAGAVRVEALQSARRRSSSSQEDPRHVSLSRPGPE